MDEIKEMLLNVISSKGLCHGSCFSMHCPLNVFYTELCLRESLIPNNTKRYNAVKTKYIELYGNTEELFEALL